MEIAGTGLFLVGLLVAIAGWIMIVVAAFRVSALWGIGSLLIPLVALIFVITHWEEGGKGFLTQLAGTAIFVMGAIIGPHARKPEPAPVAEKQPAHTAANVVYTPPPEPVAVPQPKRYVPPPVQEEAQPAIAKVYADSQSRLYYPADCATHPESAQLMSKTVANMQGYKPAECK
jgi:hypothetical protein